jgi:D,D-heptose 1,7-bisphosphate phosphatase
MAKGHFDEHIFDSICAKMRESLKERNAYLDAEYYCFHHPDGIREEYRKVCDCRKPKPGLIIRAAKEHDISLSESFVIGDGLIDVKAGREAGCKTLLVASTNGLLLRLMEEQDAQPDYLVRTLEEAVKTVENTCKALRADR